MSASQFFPNFRSKCLHIPQIKQFGSKKKNLFEVIITTIHTISAFSLFIYLFILHHKPDKAYFSNRLHKNYFNLVIKDKLIIFPFSHAVFGRTCSEVPLSWFSYYKNLRSYVTNTTLICPLKTPNEPKVWTLSASKNLQNNERLTQLVMHKPRCILSPNTKLPKCQYHRKLFSV